MLYFVTGNFWERSADVRVNPVNCVGVMGAGVARQFKERYPEMFLDYRLACRRGDVKPGKLHIFQVLDCTIANFPTKRDWRDRSRLEDVESGLVALAECLGRLGPVRVTLPALGCGLGGLVWADVKPLIQRHLGELRAEIWCYLPEDFRH